VEVFTYVIGYLICWGEEAESPSMSKVDSAEAWMVCWCHVLQRLQNSRYVSEVLLSDTRTV
jgi:hypothetical protein